MNTISLGINDFYADCKKSQKFLEQFRDHVLNLEAKFNDQWGSNLKLNGFFFTYEREI